MDTDDAWRYKYSGGQGLVLLQPLKNHLLQLCALHSPSVLP
jgi:hypothetical protein